LNEQNINMAHSIPIVHPLKLAPPNLIESMDFLQYSS